MRVPDAAVSAEIGVATADMVPISLSTNATALFVMLTTLAQGRFSDNAFMLEAGTPRTISFIAWDELNSEMIALLKSSLRVEHLAENLDPLPEPHQLELSE